MCVCACVHKASVVLPKICGRSTCMCVTCVFVWVDDVTCSFCVYFDRLVFVSQEKKRKNDRWVKRGIMEKKGKN